MSAPRQRGGSEPLLPGTLFLIDTSAYARIGNKEVADVIAGVIDAGVAATCVTLDMEAAYSARNLEELEAIKSFRSLYFRTLEINSEVEKRAVTIMQRLAAHGLHRAAGVFDVLTAAAGAYYRATLLHYDADFEHIASVTGQQHQWVVPRGSID